MIVFKLTDGEKSYAYRLPERPGEVPVGRFIEYQNKVENTKPETLRQYETIEEHDDRNKFIQELPDNEVSRIWVSYYLRELQFWTGMKPAHLALIPLRINGDSLPGEVDLFGLRAMLQKAFQIPEGTGEEIKKFSHNGRTYYLPETPDSLLGEGKDYLRRTTIGEFATAVELQRSFELQQAGSIEGVLYLIAVLCRQKSVEFPFLPDEQTEFIRKQVEDLRGMDMATVLRVGFFLSSHKIPSGAVLQCFPEVASLLLETDTDIT